MLKNRHRLSLAYNSFILNCISRAVGIALCLFLGLMLVLIPLLDASESLQEDVGLVLKVKGEWFLNGKAVAAGEALPAGGKIFHSSKKGDQSSFDYITVVRFDGKLESRSWDKTETWNDPIQLPAATKEVPSPWKRILSTASKVCPFVQS